jgi:hypothetical protein
LISSSIEATGKDTGLLGIQSIEDMIHTSTALIVRRDSQIREVISHQLLYRFFTPFNLPILVAAAARAAAVVVI